jgi:hypothetical protein
MMVCSLRVLQLPGMTNHSVTQSLSRAAIKLDKPYDLIIS